MDFLAKMGWVFQTCGLKIDHQKQSSKIRFNLPIELIENRSLPFADRKSFLNSYPENIVVKKSVQKVAIFIGCMSNYAYTNTGDSLVNILKKLNIDVLIPKQQL